MTGIAVAVQRCLRCHTRFADEAWRCTACGFTPSVNHGVLTFAPELARENDGFDEQYFHDLAAQEPCNFWFRARNKLITWAISTYFPTARDLLEVGCGTGFVLSGVASAFPRLTITGSEIFTRGLEFARKRVPAATLLQMDARDVPFVEAFDVVGAFDVLEHISDDEQVLRQMRQAVRPGGGIMLSVPQHPRLWGVVDEYSHHKRRYTREELVTKVESAGFRITAVTSFMTLLLPALVVSRLRQPKSVKEFNPLSEACLPRVLDVTLEGVLACERALIRVGFSLPVGGSLLVVARRA